MQQFPQNNIQNPNQMMNQQMQGVPGGMVGMVNAQGQQQPGGMGFVPGVSQMGPGPQQQQQWGGFNQMQQQQPQQQQQPPQFYNQQGMAQQSKKMNLSKVFGQMLNFLVQFQ